MATEKKRKIIFNYLYSLKLNGFRLQNIQKYKYERN